MPTAVPAVVIVMMRLTSLAGVRVDTRTLPKPRQLGGRALWLVDELRATAQGLPVSALLPPPSGQEAA